MPLRTTEVAQLTNVHPNTVRLYEQWGYISPVPRQENGYRMYSALHIEQMRIARLAFQQEFIQNNLRKMATSIVRLTGQERFFEALSAARAYCMFLKSEQAYVLEAVETAERMLRDVPHGRATYTHQEVAKRLQLSEETIRNWERNGLFEVARTTQNRRVYTEQTLQTLLIIRMLRSAHFSIASIRQLFENLQQGEAPLTIRTLLSLPAFQHDFYSTTDELEKNLLCAIENAQQIIVLLQALQQR